MRCGTCIRTAGEDLQLKVQLQARQEQRVLGSLPVLLSKTFPICAQSCVDSVMERKEGKRRLRADLIAVYNFVMGAGNDLCSVVISDRRGDLGKFSSLKG